MEPDKQEQSIEITDDLTTIKIVIDEIVTALTKSAVKNRQRSLAITKLEEARMWVAEAQRVE
ncbi:hypothetical protein SE17_15430 [Kouleothrix aurantiaca]|uniref:Acb2/Tad1 hairpin domain-containing protein n=1 Tax=Kouleothrix aurantiaca TaxID=186479 RepID=A0A0P9HD03_9CHLR|nr:hypothetical protein SE17_15430 [Kouleothrix aurantiaca]